METAYTALRSAWRGMIDVAIRAKSVFQRDADECIRFYNGPYDFLYGLSESPQRGDFLYVGMKKLPRPSILMTVNKVAEVVQLFGPALYNQNPQCNVTPRKPPEIPLQMFGDPNDPQVQMMVQPILQQMDQQQQIDTIRAILLQGVLNYLPTAINLKEYTRGAIDEALIKGGGLLWAKMDHPAGGSQLPILEYDTIDNLLVDPDHESIENARWIARRFIRPVWEVEAARGLPPETLKGNYESSAMISAVNSAGEDYRRRTGKTNDLIVYWGIWSKMGMGGLLRGISKEAADVDRYGQYVYLEVSENYNWFLNVPKEIWDNDEEVRRRVQWETPQWCDVPTSNGWPFEMCAFHKGPRQIWPISHVRPALGELKFINWAYSFLISGIQKRCRDFIAIAKSAGEELKNSILEGDDLTLLELEGNVGRSIDEVVKFLQHPDFHKDIWTVIEAVERNFDKRTGLTELMYGVQSRQDRSAAESTIKKDFANVRPDDMNNSVEDWMTNCFRKLALLCRWHMTGEDVAKIFGPVIGKLWDQYVATADPTEIIHQLEYRIESGSTKKPNKSKDRDDISDLMEKLMPVLSQAAMAGIPGPFNALIKMWGNAFDRDTGAMELPTPPPMPPPAPEPSANGNGKPQPVGR